MNANMLAALVWKDLSLMFKNRFFALITVLGLVFYLAMYFMMPNTVDESMEIGWHGPGLPALEEEGLVLRNYPTEDALKEAVQTGNEAVGIAIPQDFAVKLAQGGKPQASVYYKADMPEEYRQAYNLFLQELAFLMAGQSLDIEAEEVFLGPDMAGEQVAPRQRLLPVLAVFLLTMETWGLASLISSEIETGTIRALLVTKLRVPGLFLSKGITGVGFAFSQVVLLLLVTGGLQNQPLLVVTALLLGALLVTGLSFLIASVARDMMSVLGWGMLVLIVLSLPSFNILLPGLTSSWIKIIPTYYFVDVLYRIMNFGASWNQVSASMAALAAFAVAFFGLGVVVLERKMQ